MYTLEQLEEKLKFAKDISDLPIEEFVDWEGWIAMIKSHIEALKK